jgi:hypothetical protein
MGSLPAVLGGDACTVKKPCISGTIRRCAASSEFPTRPPTSHLLQLCILRRWLKLRSGSGVLRSWHNISQFEIVSGGVKYAAQTYSGTVRAWSDECALLVRSRRAQPAFASVRAFKSPVTVQCDTLAWFAMLKVSLELVVSFHWWARAPVILLAFTTVANLYQLCVWEYKVLTGLLDMRCIAEGCHTVIRCRSGAFLHPLHAPVLSRTHHPCCNNAYCTGSTATIRFSSCGGTGEEWGVVHQAQCEEAGDHRRRACTHILPPHHAYDQPCSSTQHCSS